MANNGQHHEFIEFVCKPIEDLYISSAERRYVRIPAGTEYRCSMLRDQHFSSLFRHYGKHNGVDKETLVFFFTEELMQELMPSDTPRSVHLRKNDVIVIRHRRQPQPDGLCVRLDLSADDALDLIRAFPRARTLQSADGRTALHHVAARAGRDGGKTNDVELATGLLLLGCDPSTLDNYGRTAADIAKQHRQTDLQELLAPHEFKKQMAVIRAHFLGRPDDQRSNTPDILLKRACTSKEDVSRGNDDNHHACIRFLFSALAHGNQARNFKRVVCFLYA
ncbi:hypothetical protein CTAYLR_002310 [Chrysophaeum taylorii]|uniref:Uncharacterized protein n=1 Tax=Chrysophaeum taylorii TaxID=2483200 RepID=A0AAD7UN42_9STRA|nr:hypothetical protein CTAYLR_002310 [Chrysophaeum taylorii]